MVTEDDIKDNAIGLITAALGSHQEKDPAKRISRFSEGIAIFLDEGSVYDLYRTCTLVVDISAFLVELSATSLNLSPEEIMSQLATEVKNTGIISIQSDETDLGLDETL